MTHWPCTAPDPWPQLLRESGGAWVRLMTPQGPADGFLLGAGEAWVLLAVLDPSLRPDGFLALRRDDLEAVRDPAPRAHLVRGALATWSRTLPEIDALPLDTLPGLLAAVARRWPLVHLFRQGPAAPGYTLGQYLGHQDDTGWLLPVDADDAEYGLRPLPVPLTAVSRVRFGDFFSCTLSRVAAGVLVPEPEDAPSEEDQSAEAGPSYSPDA